MDLPASAITEAVLDERLRAEIDQIGSNARAAKARAMLDELARTGATNTAELEAMLGKKSPALRLLLEVIRSSK